MNITFTKSQAGPKWFVWSSRNFYGELMPDYWGIYGWTPPLNIGVVKQEAMERIVEKLQELNADPQQQNSTIFKDKF